MVFLHSLTIDASLLLVLYSSTDFRARSQAQKETQEITHVYFVEPDEVPASWWKGSHIRSPDAAALFYWTEKKDKSYALAASLL